MNTILIGVAIVGGFCIWKFWLQPIMNKDKPIEPPKDYKTFGEELEESMSTSVDF